MTDLPEARKSKGWLPWLVVLLAVAGCIVVIAFGLLPAHSEGERLREELDKSKATAELERKQLQALLKDKSSLDQEHFETKTKLEEALAAKEKALAELEQARKDLSETLGTQIAAGDVLIKEVNGELVVDVADRLLFDTGEANVNDAGQDLLRQVAKSMKRLPPGQVFQVGGHTDSKAVVSKELVQHYPTNWELAAARATNVVRFLQEKAGVPGRQLVAASFSQYRPAQTNKTETGRQKNRRIEIVLLRQRS